MPRGTISERWQHGSFRPWLAVTILACALPLLADSGSVSGGTASTSLAPVPTPKLLMLTDAESHLFRFAGKNQWIYGYIESVNGQEVNLTPYGTNMDFRVDPPFAFSITSFEANDQKFIQNWIMLHPWNRPGVLPPSPPLAPTGVVSNYPDQVAIANYRKRLGEVPVYVLDTTGVLKGRTVTSVASAAFTSHFLALCSDGTLVAWGSDRNGELGVGHHIRDKNTPDAAIHVTSPVLVHRPGAFKDKQIMAIAVSASNSYAVCTDGSLYKWGIDGAMLSGKTVDEPTLFDQGALKGRKVIAIAPSGDTCLALCSDGTLVGWGSSLQWWGGKFSQDNNFHEPFVVDTRGLLKGKTVAALTTWGVLCSDGTLAVWNPTKTKIPALFTVRMEGPLAGRKVIAIDLGQWTYDFYLALCSDGTVVEWGGTLGPPKSKSLAELSAQKKMTWENMPDTATTTLGPDELFSAPNPNNGHLLKAQVISGAGVLTGKTVTTLSGQAMQCSDATWMYWSGMSPLRLVDENDALTGKAILFVTSCANGYSVLFKEPDYPVATVTETSATETHTP